MIRIVRAMHHDERGLAMVVSLMVAFVVLMLSTIVVAQSLHSLDASGLDRRRLTSINAAEAGTAAWWEDLQTNALADLDCSDKVETLASGPSEATFTAGVTFYAADGTTEIACPLSADNLPTYAKVVSTGASEGGAPRQMETLARLSPIYGGSGSAIMSNNGATFSNNFDIYGLNGYDGDVYVLSGNLSMGNSTEIRGNVYVPNGSATVENSVHIFGGLWSLGSATMSNSARVDGDLRTNTGAATGSSSASVGGDAYSGTTISGLSVGGTSYTNYALGAVPTLSYPDFTYDASDWTGYTINTFSGAGSTPCDQALAFIKGSWTGNHVVRIESTCQLNFSGLNNITVAGDLAIVTDGTILISNNTNWNGTSGSVKKLMFLKPTGTACSGYAFQEQGGTTYNAYVNVVIYVPSTCSVSLANRNGFKGQVYAGTVNVTNQFTMTYTPVLVPGLAAEVVGFDQDISYVREI